MPTEKDVFQWIVYYKYNNSWNYAILNRRYRSLDLNQYALGSNPQASLNHIAVTAVDRTGNESLVNEIEVKK